MFEMAVRLKCEVFCNRANRSGYYSSIIIAVIVKIYGLLFVEVSIWKCETG